MTVAVRKEEIEDAPRPKRRRCPANALKDVQHERRFWWLKAGPGDTADDIRLPEYFSLCAPRMRRHDLITVLLDDESQEIELVIEKVLRDEVFVSVRKAWAREPVSAIAIAVDDKGEFRCEWRAGEAYCIVRRSDGFPILKGYNDALAAIAEWRKQQPRPVLS